MNLFKIILGIILITIGLSAASLSGVQYDRVTREMYPEDLSVTLQSLIVETLTTFSGPFIIPATTAPATMTLNLDGPWLTITNVTGPRTVLTSRTATEGQRWGLRSTPTTTSIMTFGSSWDGTALITTVTLTANVTSDIMWERHGGSNYVWTYGSLYSVNGTNGINATVDVLVAGTTTNRLVFYGGILVSNIVTGFW